MMQRPSVAGSGTRPAPAGRAGSTGDDDLDATLGREAAAEVADFFNSLDKALRARRLYQANNPVYQGFLTALDGATERLWNRLPSLQVAVDEHVFRAYGKAYPCGEGRDTLPFLFYKDGVRFLTFLPGFENEIEGFLTVLYRARQLDQRSDDDIVTLLWQAEFVNFQYTYVDVLAEGIAVPDASSLRHSVRPVRETPGAAGGTTSAEPAAVQDGQPPVAQAITRGDFNETLYFLSHGELQVLQGEVKLELERDVRADVLSALFDRLEEPNPERQVEIIGILRQLLPTFLGAGELRHATIVLTELSAILERGVLGEAERSAAEAVYRELSDPAVLAQLLQALQDGSIDPDGPDLGVFLTHLGPTAMPLLLRTMETTSMLVLQQKLQHAMEGLARKHPPQLVALLRSESPEVVRGAARLVAQFGVTEAVPSLAELLRAAPVEQRRVAVETLAHLRNSASLEALRAALQDADREVRIGAVRGLAAAVYAPARADIEAVVRARAIRTADLTEQMAFFEAFGALASAEHTGLLDRMLNGRRLFGKASPELRACAAMALGRMGTPAARAALQKASGDTQPMVRNAVHKALRQEATS